MMKSSVFLKASLAFLTLANVTPASGEVKTWVSSGGSFHTASNWNTGTVPGSGDFAVFSESSNGTTVVSSNVQTQNVGVDGIPAVTHYATIQIGSGNTWTTQNLFLSHSDINASHLGPTAVLNVRGGLMRPVFNTFLKGDSYLDAELGGRIESGALIIGGNELVQHSARLTANGTTSSMSFSHISGNTNLTTTRLRALNGGEIRVNGTIHLGNNARFDLSGSGIIDAGGMILGTGASVSGHGVLIGNSAGLTVASPNGAVDTSYDMNIGSRRADIFSNAPATLRGDVSLSTGGLLNSAQTVHLIGSEYTQNGGTTSIGNQFQIDNGTMIQSNGNVNIGTEVFVGLQAGSNGTYTISGGTLNTGTLSGAADPDLEIGFEGTGTLNQSGGVVNVADELVIGHEASGNGTVNLSGGTLNVMDDSHRGVYVGFRGTGELAVSGTGQLTTQSVLSVGTEAGAMGTVTQTGGSISVHEVRLADAAGAQATYSMQGGALNTDSHLYVGEADVATYTQTGGDVTVGGQFRVNNGAMATINDGTLHSVDSLRVGTSTGLSSMTQNGGLVKTDEYFAIGSGGNGTYTMTGGTLEARAVSRGLYVGTEAGATGSMNQTGGHVDVGDLVVGNGSSQSGEYTFSDGTIAVRDRLVVGNHVVGTFNQSGGIINASGAPVTVGNVATAAGSAYSMSGGTLNADSLVVGNYGDATFTQTAGTVNASSVVVAQQAGSTSSYSLTGGTLTTDSLSFGDGTGSFNLDGGTLNVGTLNDAGGTFSVMSGTLNADNVTLATLNMSDGLLDLGTLNGDLNMSGGILAPGDSPGITTITGDYLLSGGLLDMELAGLVQGTEYDFLDVNGDWTITGGDLQISLLSGFMPTAGNSFDLFDFNSLTGMFDNVFLPTLGTGLAWNTSGLYTTGVISVNSTAAVPEPSSFGLLAVSGVGCLVMRKRRKTQSREA